MKLCKWNNVHAEERLSLLRLKTGSLSLIFGDVSKQNEVPRLLVMKEHVMKCSDSLMCC